MGKKKETAHTQNHEEVNTGAKMEEHVQKKKPMGKEQKHMKNNDNAAYNNESKAQK